MTDAEEEALDESISRKIAWLDAHNGVPADDLRALGIDRAERRWAAALDYIAELREAHTLELNRGFVVLIAGAFAEQSAAARGTPGWSGYFDITDAIDRIKKHFGQKAADVVAQSFFKDPSRWPERCALPESL